VLTRVDTGGAVGQVIRAPERPYSYVAHAGDTEQVHHVSVYDDATGTRVAQLTLADGPTPRLILSPDGQRLYAVSGSDIVVLDTTTNTVAGSFAASAPVGPVAVSADSRTVYVAQSNSVLAVNAGSGRVLGSAEFGGDTIDRLVVSSDGGHAYVASRNGATSTVSALNLATGTVTPVHTVTDATVTDMQLSADGGLLLANVTDQGGYGYSRVTVIATGADTVRV
jgi:DNA-binding beta-propeller fold protein YncE